MGGVVVGVVPFGAWIPLSCASVTRLGHSSITVTLGTYGHLSPPHVEEMLTESLARAYIASRPGATTGA